jgi:hypothetical protein
VTGRGYSTPARRLEVVTELPRRFSKVLCGITRIVHQTHNLADKQAMVARVVPLSAIIASDVANALAWLLLRGGMLANRVRGSRYFGDDRSPAVGMIWFARNLLFCCGRSPVAP